MTESASATEARSRSFTLDGHNFRHAVTGSWHRVEVLHDGREPELLFGGFGIDLDYDVRGMPVTDEEVRRVAGLYADIIAKRIPHDSAARYLAEETGNFPPYGYGCDWIARAQFLKDLVAEGAIDGAGNVLKPAPPASPAMNDDEFILMLFPDEDTVSSRGDGPGEDADPGQDIDSDWECDP